MEQFYLLIVLVGIIFLSTSLASATSDSSGIYPLGDDGQGVVLCGEALTINLNADVSESDMFDMFDEALQVIEEGCEK